MAVISLETAPADTQAARPDRRIHPPAAARRGELPHHRGDDVCRHFFGLVAPYDPLTIDFASILAPPSWEHWCGTDAFGRDICSRLIYGSRTALVIGFWSSFIGSTLGAMLGVASAYFGGRIDNIIQRFMDILLAFPLIVLALVVVAAFRRFTLGGVDVNLIVAIAIPIIPRVARVVRAAALVGARHALCRCRARGRLFQQPHHLPPHGAECGRALSHHADRLHRAGDPGGGLAVVSGLGVAEPTAAWGLMLSGNAADFYREAPWMILFPGAAISLAVFAFNLFGDSLRDFLDPRFKSLAVPDEACHVFARHGTPEHSSGQSLNSKSRVSSSR